ncbi:PIN-like domain-containing protein [Erwinia tasmaniensis]|uniref:PIN like domain-containing protein n=1 Tax=Erwinia tasmaniensis (strain DSM 17950 / CFBP 7177 / CIP 109463 / NCPPB 4357 / Et1/99) TaxID=465817 RepID=B2VBB0_ERWT9|nr:PIN-like domain-containing protein [Erwinia tasmaniensis]CAO97493.1 Hypothetical protein ETA_24470 [Erwinia tasmaniensis Et1/99]
MKDKFKGFYSPKDDDIQKIWNSDKTLFIFDANCLLNLYKCEPQTRDDIFNVMENISDRSGFPFQTCFEYQRGRITVINESIKKLNDIKGSLKKIGTNTENALSDNGVKIHLYTRLAEELSKFQEEINKPLTDFIKNHIEPRLQSAISISEKDFIREKIDSIVLDKCGEAPDQEQINKINSEGEDRYRNFTPPGFNDEKKSSRSYYSGVFFEDKFGDLYLWKEVIEKSKSENVKNVVLISDDRKSDWWYIPEKNKPKGPLEALQTEIYKNSHIENFKLLNQSSFLYEAKKYRKGINIHEESVKEIQAIQSENHDEFIKKYEASDLSRHQKNKIMKLFYGENEYNTVKYNPKFIDREIPLVSFTESSSHIPSQDRKLTYASNVLEHEINEFSNRLSELTSQFSELNYKKKNYHDDEFEEVDYQLQYEIKKLLSRIQINIKILKNHKHQLEFFNTNTTTTLTSDLYSDLRECAEKIDILSSFRM